MTSRKETLRKAGQEYLERAVNKANLGQDPFALEAPQPKVVHHEEDPDVQAFGKIFEGSKIYLLMGAHVASRASSLVFLKGALLSMPTPAVMTFLHMTCLAVCLWGLCYQFPLIEPLGLTMNNMKGASVKSALAGCKLLAMSAVVLHGSVYLLVSWMCLAPLAYQLAEHLWDHKRLPNELLGALGASGLGVLLLFVKGHPGGPFTLFMMAVWMAMDVAERCWARAKDDTSFGGRITDPSTIYHLQDIGQREETLSPATLMFFQHALPALPVLVLGFLCLEGLDLVEHEPSVPALTVVLSSCVAYTLSCCTEVVLLKVTGPSLRWKMHVGACLGTVVFDSFERDHEHGWLALLAVCLAIGGSEGYIWLTEVAGRHGESNSGTDHQDDRSV